MRDRLHLPFRVALVVAACLVVAGCVGPLAAAPTPMIGPGQPCAGQDSQAKGYYPSLEARLPKVWDGRAPDTLDSGRFCSAGALGYLATAGIHELRYGGAAWTASGGQSSLSMLVYEAAGLTAAKLAEAFYRASQYTPNLDGLTRRDVVVDGRPGFRLDALIAESRDVRIVWPSADGRAVNVVDGMQVTASALQSAEAAFGT